MQASKYFVRFRLLCMLSCDVATCGCCCARDWPVQCFPCHAAAIGSRIRSQGVYSPSYCYTSYDADPSHDTLLLVCTADTHLSSHMAHSRPVAQRAGLAQFLSLSVPFCVPAGLCEISSAPHSTMHGRDIYSSLHQSVSGARAEECVCCVWRSVWV